MNSTQPSKTSSVDSDLMSTAVAPVTVGASASASGMIEIGSSSVAPAPAPVLVSAPSAPASATAVGSELMSTATASSTKGASLSSAMVELGSSSPSAAPAPSSATTTIAKPRRKYHKSNQGQSPLFAFHETPHDLSSASSIGRPKRKLKAITRFDECQYYNSISNSKRSTKIKTGEGFQCPRCSSFCSYDVRGCDLCGLECYYEAGVGVVTLKERRVSVNGDDVNSPKKKRRRSRKNNQIKEGTTSSQTDVIDLSQSRSQTEARPDAECAPQNIPTNHNQSSQSQSSPRSVASAMSARLGQEDVNLGSSSPRESETTVDDSSIPKTTAYTLIDDVDATIIKRDQSKETCDMIAADTVSQMLSIPTEAPKRMMLAVPKDASITSISKTKAVSPRKNAQENSSKPQLKSMIRTVTADGDDTHHHKLSISSSADPTLRGLDCESNNKTSVNNNNNKPAGKDEAAVTAGDEKPLAIRFTKKRGPGRPPKSGTPAHESKSAHNNNNKISKANNTSSKVALGSAIPNNNNINNNNNHNNNNNNNNDNDNDKSTKGNKNNNNNNNPAMTKQLIEQREQIKLATRSNLELTLQVSRLQADNDGMKTTLKVCKQKQKASLLDSTTSAEDECKIVPMEVKAAARGETTLRGSSEEMVEKNECLSLQSLHYWNKSSEGGASKSGSSSPSNLSPPLNLEQQLAELQAKYDTHLSRTALSECSYKATISNLEVSLKKKDEEVTCISATMFSLRGRITTQKEDLDKGQEELFKLRQVLADDSLNTGNIESLYNPTLDNDADDPSSLPHPLSPMHTMPTDVSNCSSQMEELQSKMEDVVAERDAADKQVKELLCVQLQKDELLVKLQDAETMLAHSEKGRKEDKERYENQERAVCDNASEKRERICELEGMLEVVTGQRDRASARVRKLLLSDKNSSIDDYILEGGEVTNNKSSAQKVLDSFQLENNQLATSLKESKAEVLLLRSDEATAVKTCATLEDTVKELQTRIEQIEYQNSKLQQQQHTNRFHESSFRSGHDDCLRELENINTTNDLTAADESASLNDGSLVSSLNGNGEGTGTHARILGLPTSVASLNVLPPSPPLLAGAAETERQEEISELDGLTDALGSLGPMNEFEDFLLGLGLEDEQS